MPLCLQNYSFFMNFQEELILDTILISRIMIYNKTDEKRILINIFPRIYEGNGTVWRFRTGWVQHH